jgi:hypothetical protein
VAALEARCDDAQQLSDAYAEALREARAALADTQRALESSGARCDQLEVSERRRCRGAAAGW